MTALVQYPTPSWSAEPSKETPFGGPPPVFTRRSGPVVPSPPPPNPQLQPRDAAGSGAQRQPSDSAPGRSELDKEKR
jgi:hypothetical protein